MASVSELIRMQDALTSRHEQRFAVMAGQALSNFIHHLSDEVVTRKDDFDLAASAAVPAPWVTNAGTGRPRSPCRRRRSRAGRSEGRAAPTRPARTGG
jgi:hypothetical protein